MPGARRSAPAAQRASSSNADGAKRSHKRAKTGPTQAAADKSLSRADSRRRLDRRQTDEQVERIIAKQLYPKFARELIEGMVAEDGSPPRSAIAEELRKCRGAQEYLKQEFWGKFFEKFPFHKGIVGMIPEPTCNSGVRSEGLEAIAPMHDKNLAKRHAANLVTLLRTTPQAQRAGVVWHHNDLAAIGYGHSGHAQEGHVRLVAVYIPDPGAAGAWCQCMRTETLWGGIGQTCRNSTCAG